MAQQASKTPGNLIGQGRTAQIYAWEDSQALKLYFAGWSASSVEQEAQVSRAVATTGLPVPATGNVVAVDGRFGILFERIAGPSMLQQFSARPWTVVHSLRVFTDLHLAMHTRTVPGLPSQREQVTRRGQRLDETKPGSGLGLSIVVDLGALYGGNLTLATAPIGGLRAELVLPAV